MLGHIVGVERIHATREIGESVPKRRPNVMRMDLRWAAYLESDSLTANACCSVSLSVFAA